MVVIAQVIGFDLGLAKNASKEEKILLTHRISLWINGTGQLLDVNLYKRDQRVGRRKLRPGIAVAGNVCWAGVQILLHLKGRGNSGNGAENKVRNAKRGPSTGAALQ